MIYEPKQRRDRKTEEKCDHSWEFVDKSVDGGGHQLWEFYCRNCLKIITVSDDGRQEVVE